MLRFFNPSLKKALRDGAIILSMGAISVLIAAAFNFWNGAQQLDTSIQNKMRQVETDFLALTNFTADTMEIMTGLIRANYEDHIYVSTILNEFSRNPRTRISSPWTIFSWANADHFITVDSFYGVMEHPFDLRSRDYIPATAQQPGQLFLGKPVIGSTSRRWMIPCGYGLRDINGEYIGALTLGFDIAVLIEQFQESIGSNTVDFALLDNQGNLVLKSSDNVSEFNQKSTENHSYIGQDLQKFLRLHQKWETGKSILDDNQFHTYFYHFTNLPYILYVRMDHHSFIKNVIITSLEKTIPFAILILIVIILSMIVRFKHSSLSQRLDKAYRLLDKSRQSKDEFLVHCIFELRNPVSMILSLSESLQQETFGPLPEQYKNFIKDIELYAHDVLEFVSDVTDLSQINIGHFPVYPTILDIGAIVRRSMNMNMAMAMHRQIKLRSNIQSHLPKLFIDPKRLKQIIAHLIRNAIANSPNFSTITVGVKLLDNGMEVTVVDSGRGLSEEEIDILFGKKRYLETSLPIDLNPAGSGLRLVQLLCSLMDIQFSIASEKKNGTKATLFIDKKMIDFSKDRATL